MLKNIVFLKEDGNGTVLSFEGSNVCLIKLDFAAMWAQKTSDKIEQCGFARPAFAGYAQNLARVHLQ
jgi:hypothetical protein